MLKSALSTMLLAVALCAQAAFAAPSETPAPPAAPADPNYAAGKQAVAAKDWKTAIDAFGKAVASDPANANAHNFLAYAHRKSGNLDMAFRHYNEALRLDPAHRGAHEYIGEAYLMAGNLAQAEAHLAILDKLCLFGCEEYSDLKQAIAEFKQRPATK